MLPGLLTELPTPLTTDRRRLFAGTPPAHFEADNGYSVNPAQGSGCPFSDEGEKLRTGPGQSYIPSSQPHGDAWPLANAIAFFFFEFNNTNCVGWLQNQSILPVTFVGFSKYL